MDLFTTVARLPYSILGHHRNDTVIADRLNYKYTVILFVIFSIVVSNKQFGSEQIVCWSPGHFVQNYVNYVNQVKLKSFKKITFLKFQKNRFLTYIKDIKIGNI